MRFCFFLTCYTLIIKGILIYYLGLHCVLRNITNKDEKMYAFYSGLIGGIFSFMFIKEKNRKLWALYMLVRAFDTNFHKLNQYSFIYS